MTTLPRVHVHPNRRFLVTSDERPFFWLGDTAWELFHRLTLEEARHYLENRARKGFTVFQAVVLAEFDGLRTPNANGDVPLVDCDPARPNERYFQFVDTIVRMAGAFGLYVALLPTWGDKVTPLWGAGPVIFKDPHAARSYGEWLGARYRHDSHIIWMLGGDRPSVIEDGPRRPPDREVVDYRPIWRAMAEGIRTGVDGHALMTYHTWPGLPGTSSHLHQEAWLDLNTMQSGHGSGHDVPVWEGIAHDYGLTPPKPTLDAEPNYEDHPVNPWPSWDPASGYFRDGDVRRQVYRSVFAGACGVTYGHHSVWSFNSPRCEPINHPCMYWPEALDRPGAAHLIHLRRLLESRPYFSRIPDQSLIASDAGSGAKHLRATRDSDGRYAFVYFPEAVRAARIDLSRLSAARVTAWWYDTHTGEAYPAGAFAANESQEFTTPVEWHDWVLVLDDATAGFEAPGQAA